MFLRKLGLLGALLALFFIAGGHWALLQAGAWTGMIAQYTQQSGLLAGLAQTFDGAHPCPICQAIQSGKTHEQKKAPLLQSELKRECLAPWHRFRVFPMWNKMEYSNWRAQLESVSFEPTVPPPRAV